MEEWIKVDPSTLNPPKQETVDGTKVTIKASPYDVPDAYRSYYDEQIGRHVVEFRYLTTEEKVRRENYGPHLTLRIGKNSSRVYGVEIGSPALQQRRWLQITVNALNEREEKVGRKEKFLNYAIASRLLRANAPRLEQALAY
jgi:hypothetical protein